jgi:hypothetical protein
LLQKLQHLQIDLQHLQMDLDLQHLQIDQHLQMDLDLQELQMDLDLQRMLWEAVVDEDKPNSRRVRADGTENNY